MMYISTTILGPISHLHPEAIISIKSGNPDKQQVLKFYTEWLIEFQNSEINEQRILENDKNILKQLSDSYWANIGLIAILNQYTKIHQLSSDIELMNHIANNIITCGDIRIDIYIPQTVDLLNSWCKNCKLAINTYPRILNILSTKEDEKRIYELTKHHIIDSATWWCG